jgi:aryl-alcohol dehydrogenase-like predicted oxidoreductase
VVDRVAQGLRSDALSNDLGRTGMRVSGVALGTWQWGGVSWRALERGAIERLLDRAYECGVNLVDVCPAYGNGEVQRVLGPLLARYGAHFLVCAKVGLVEDGSRRGSWDPVSLRKAIDDILRALRREYVDILALHSPPPIVAKTDFAWRVLETARREGLARHVGIAVDADVETALTALDRGVDVVQIRHNIWFHEARRVITAAARAGVGVLVNSPLAHGYLAGQYDRYVQIPEDEFPKGPFREERPAEMLDELLRKATRLRAFAESHSVTLPELALRYAACVPGVASVIVGQRTISELETNIAAVRSGSLPDGVQTGLASVLRELSPTLSFLGNRA